MHTQRAHPVPLLLFCAAEVYGAPEATPGCQEENQRNTASVFFIANAGEV